jgi:hypothetical protein
MAYLYNEMTPEEKIRFEKFLSENKDLQKELEDLQAVRQQLGTWKDKEIMEPITITEQGGPRQWLSPFIPRKSFYLRPILAVAASLALLLLLGYLTHFQISFRNNDLFIGFQHAENENIQLDEEQIMSLVDQKIAEHHRALNQMIQSSDSAVNMRFASLETALETQEQRHHLPPGRSDNVQDLKEYVKLVQQNQNKMFVDYLQTLNDQQQQYFKSMLAQFSDYLQEQRTEDLLMIQNNLLTLKENQDQQKQETSQVLARILTSVNTQND